MGECANLQKYRKEYIAWRAMKQRTSNNISDKLKLKYYSDIEVCPAWKLSFECFLRDMGQAPSNSHTLDRIDNSKGYSKENCRWATCKEQANNRRNNVKYHTYQHTDGSWVVRKYCNGIRIYLGKYSSREQVKTLYDI